MNIRKFITAAFCLISLSGCAEIELASHVLKKLPGPDSASPSPASKDEGTFKVGNAYKVNGRWYEPEETYSFTQTGVASWYGREFHGKRTANGEIFDMNALTAAHKTLQMPSIIRVTNLENGRSAVVRVNDRGPFSKSRILDVSKHTAEVLGFKNQGTARVKIQLLGEESREVAQLARGGQNTRGFETALNQGGRANPRPIKLASRPVELITSRLRPVPEVETLASIAPAAAPPPVPLSPNGIYVQAGAFHNAENAQKMVEALRNFGNAHINPIVSNGKSLYRVRFGPMPDTQKADMLLAQLENAGRSDVIVVVD